MKLIHNQSQLHSAVIVTICIALIAMILLIRGCCYADEISEIIPYLISVESGGNAQAVGKNGEIGLMQISPIVFKEYQMYGRGIPPQDSIMLSEWTIDNMFNPYSNKQVGQWYLNRLKTHYLKDHYTIYTLLASYNWGIGNVKKVNYNPKRFPRSVKRYVNKVLSLWNKAHKFDPIQLIK